MKSFSNSVSLDFVNECLTNDARIFFTFAWIVNYWKSYKRASGFAITRICLVCHDLMCHVLHKFSTCRLNQVKREHVPIHVRCFQYFTLRDSKTAFARLCKIICSFISFLGLLLNEFLQSEIMQKSWPVQNITRIIVVAD